MSIPQQPPEVKPQPPQCSYDGCPEKVFRHGLCFDHFVEEEDARWDDHQATRRTAQQALGYA